LNLKTSNNWSNLNPLQDPIRILSLKRISVPTKDPALKVDLDLDPIQILMQGKNIEVLYGIVMYIK